MYQYFVKIVPTVYKKLNGEVRGIVECFYNVAPRWRNDIFVELSTEFSLTRISLFQIVQTNQFSVTKHRRTVKQISGTNGVPGALIKFDSKP